MIEEFKFRYPFLRMVRTNCFVYYSKQKYQVSEKSQVHRRSRGYYKSFPFAIRVIRREDSLDKRQLS